MDYEYTLDDFEADKDALEDWWLDELADMVDDDK